MGIVLICLGGVALVVGGFRLMARINRADQQKVDRLREEWEAGDKEKPWSWGVNWGNGGSG